MAGLIGKKIGMTSIFDDQGKNVPCTVIEAGPCVVTQIKLKILMDIILFRLVLVIKKKKNVQNQKWVI